jgi:hypothetical protein
MGRILLTSLRHVTKLHACIQPLMRRFLSYSQLYIRSMRVLTSNNADYEDDGQD